MGNSDAEELVSTLNKIEVCSFESGQERVKVLKAAQALCRKLETPIEAVIRTSWVEPTIYAILRIFHDVGMFKLLAEDGGKAKTNAELAGKAQMDPKLSARFLKHLASYGYLREVSKDVYAPTPFCLSMTDPIISDGVPFMFDTFMPALVKLPEYLAGVDHRNPSDPTACPWSHACNTKDSLFAWLHNNPRNGAQFANHMAGYARGKPAWTDFYPVEERLVKGYDADTALIVDMGGAMGHDMEAFRTKHPTVQGKVIVQDLPEMIARIESNPVETGVEGMAHDFFTPQPVRGARAYYLHSVLHDWPDADALRILEALKPALTPGYSRILINEYAIADTGADSVATSLDMIMMIFAGAAERTEESWRKLLGQAGLKLNAVWVPLGVAWQSVIEAELA